MRKLRSGGGWPAVWYALKTARKSGGIVRFLKALGTKNACKTCALGMGGQSGGMVDESGRFPEICKKSMQAMSADMQGRIGPEFFETFDFARLRRCTPRDLEHMGRLVNPVYAGAGDSHYKVISWKEAIGRCVGWLKQTRPEEAFFYSSGRSSNEAGFLMQLFARLYGTNHVNNCSFYCHQASGVGLGSAIGIGTGTVVLEDIEHCDLFILIGGNPASNHPRLMRQLVNLRRRGGEVVVVNPLKETGLVRFAVPSDLRSLLFGSEIASIYVQPHIGGDIAFLHGVAKRIDEWGAVDEGFLKFCTEGGEAFRDSLRELDWSELVEASGVGQRTIDEVAKVYAESSRTIFAWTMGVTHHLHGVGNVRAIANLGLMRGMVGKQGAGVLPIRGHSNVQGVGSVGVTPKLKRAIFDRLEKHFDVKLPQHKGMDTLSCLEAMHDRKLHTGWCLGGNLFGATPDSKWTAAAFERLDSLVYFSTTLNTGHAWGRAKETLILPMLARDEEHQPTTQESMFSFVRMSEGGQQRHAGPRSEVETIAAIAEGVLGNGGPIDWAALQQHREIRQIIGAVVPGYEEIAKIDETGREFYVGGRSIHELQFPTKNGKAKLHVVPIPEMANADGQLRLMTIRSEGQFNTVVYEEEDIYRHQERRDVILMSRLDIERLELALDQRVTVRSETGEIKGILVREFDIRPGNAAMYYPEANVLVPRTADPDSRTPAFKNVLVTVTPTSKPVAIRPLQLAT
ncbi:MAG: FdhF/YdeP family oxidoreductase [Planctomycetota bacterium]